MKSLVRPEYLDLTWSADDLDSAAAFWLRMYERVCSQRAFSSTPRHVTEIRLWGFPSSAGEDLRRELQHRAEDSDLTGPNVELRVADMLVLASEAIHGDAAPPGGLGLPILAGQSFDGLLVEIRFCASGSEGRFLKTGVADSTIVIIGQLRNGGLLVKSVWRSGSSRWEDDVYWSFPPPEEAALMAGLEGFRRTGEVDNQLARHLFKPSADDHLGGWALRMIHVPFECPRLLPLLSRVVIFALLVAGFGSLIYLTAVNEKWLLLVPSLLFGLYVLMLLWQFMRYEISLLLSRDAVRAGYAELYQESASYAILTAHESEALCGDPSVRKYTTEILAAGLIFAGDVASRATSERDVIYRIFRAKDGASYLVLICQLKSVHPQGCHIRMWPAAIALQAQTFFTSGGRVDSVTGLSYGYIRVTAGPDSLISLDPESVDPIAFLRSHEAATEAFAMELGLTRRPHESLEQYSRRQEAIHEEERQHFNDHPYSWRDHLRWYLQLPRREQRALR